MSAKVDGFRDAVATLRIYRAAAWLYHHGPAEIGSPLTDAEFDEMERLLEMPKTLGHSIALTEDEQAMAIDWAMAINADRNTP